jgi:LPXTG-site transpeptidase (sortase) family protein
VVRSILVMLAVLAGAFVLHLTVVSSLQQRAAQGRVFDRFRAELATGIAPIGPTGTDGRELPRGTPVALLDIPAIDLRQVVVEGTDAATLFDGPGHRRDTPLPGQAGTSIVFGRRAAYGGPFARIGQLTPGAVVNVTTGQGVFEYRVVTVRRDGDPLPTPVPQGAARLTLITADGSAYLPAGALRVDAELAEGVVGGPARTVATGALPDDEALMSSSPATLWALVLWLQALVLLAVAAVWAWYRWGRPQAWIVFAPPLLLVGIGAAGELARLLPNVM